MTEIIVAAFVGCAFGALTSWARLEWQWKGFCFVLAGVFAYHLGVWMGR